MSGASVVGMRLVFRFPGLEDHLEVLLSLLAFAGQFAEVFLLVRLDLHQTH